MGRENRRGPGQRRAAGLAFWPAKEGENVTHQRVDGGVTLCGSRLLGREKVSFRKPLIWVSEQAEFSHAEIDDDVIGIEVDFHPESILTEHGKRLLENFLAQR